MPMSEDEKIEKVQRLLTAHRKTKEVLGNEPVTWEVHPGSEIARNWTVITAAYSGLEQTMKYLIAEENAQSIAELIERRGRKKSPYETHDVAKLFSKLREATQEVRPRHVSAEAPTTSPSAATAATQVRAKREEDPGRRGGDGVALSTARV